MSVGVVMGVVIVYFIFRKRERYSVQYTTLMSVLNNTVTPHSPTGYVLAYIYLYSHIPNIIKACLCLVWRARPSSLLAREEGLARQTSLCHNLLLCILYVYIPTVILLTTCIYIILYIHIVHACIYDIDTLYIQVV